MGEAASFAIILLCAGGVFLAARSRRAELARAGLPYWRPVHVAVLAVSVAGLIGLAAAQWWLGQQVPEFAP